MKKLLRKDRIEHSTSPWNSPLWIVPKRLGAGQNHALKIIVDCRKLNEKTVSDAYPFLNIQEILKTFGNPPFFSVFDLVSNFHQVGVNPADQEKTTFPMPYRYFHLLCILFELRNAPATL